MGGREGRHSESRKQSRNLCKSTRESDHHPYRNKTTRRGTRLSESDVGKKWLRARLNYQEPANQFFREGTVTRTPPRKKKGKSLLPWRKVCAGDELSKGEKRKENAYHVSDEEIFDCAFTPGGAE